MTPLVSVIITTYKRSDMLKRAIDSVLNQTYNNIEVLIVDDNDDDAYHLNVKKTLDHFFSSDERVKYYFSGQNHGACWARNYGFEQSHGDYINFLDDDDLFHPQKIELQIKKYLKNPNFDGTIGCYELIKDENGNTIMHNRKQLRGDVFYPNMLDMVCQTSVPLFKRDIFARSGGFEDIPSSQDILMLTRVFAVNPNYDYVPKELVTIVHHSGERISNGNRKIEGAVELQKRLRRYYGYLTKDQIVNVKLACNKTIVNACLMCNEKKKAWYYFRQRRLINRSLSIDDAKLLFGIIFGTKAKVMIHRCLTYIMKTNNV